MDRVAVLKQLAHQSVSGLVVSDNFALFGVEYPTPSLRARNDSLQSLIKVTLDDLGVIPTSCQERAFVKHVCQIGAREPGSQFGEFAQLQVGLQRLAFGMDF